MSFLKKCSAVSALSFMALSSLPLAAHSVETDWKAFGSAYYGQTLNSDVLPYNISDTRAYFKPFSLVGANLSVKFDDQWSVAAQVVASGRPAPTSDYNMFTQWAYLTYTPWDGLAIRGGRQRFPVFTASEFFNIGYQLPYRAIPSAVYFMSPFVSFDGASITQTFDIGSGTKLAVEVFGGTPVLALAGNPSAFTSNYSDLLGVRATVDGDGWRIRGQISRNTSVNTAVFLSGLVFNAHETIASAGYRFDKYNIVSWGELVWAGADDGQEVPALGTLGGKFLGRSLGGYALFGYKLGDFMPRYTFAQTNAKLGISNGQLTSHTFGLNYYASKYAVVKAEFEMNVIPTVGGGYYAVSSGTGATGTTGNSIYVGIDLFGGSEKEKS